MKYRKVSLEQTEHDSTPTAVEDGGTTSLESDLSHPYRPTLIRMEDSASFGHRSRSGFVPSFWCLSQTNQSWSPSQRPPRLQSWQLPEETGCDAPEKQRFQADANPHGRCSGWTLTVMETIFSRSVNSEYDGNCETCYCIFYLFMIRWRPLDASLYNFSRKTLIAYGFVHYLSVLLNNRILSEFVASFVIYVWVTVQLWVET